MPLIPEPPERISDELIELRPIAGWDIPEVLIAHQDDCELYRRLGMSRPPTGAVLGTEVERADALRRAGEALKLSIVEPGANTCRGRVDVVFDWSHGGATVRVWVAPQLRGRGYEQRAAELTCDWLRDSAGLRELQVELLT